MRCAGLAILKSIRVLESICLHLVVNLGWPQLHYFVPLNQLMFKHSLACFMPLFDHFGAHGVSDSEELPERKRKTNLGWSSFDLVDVHIKKRASDCLLLTDKDISAIMFGFFLKEQQPQSLGLKPIMEVTFSYRHLARQTSITRLRGSLEEDKIFVIMKFFKCSIRQRVRSDPIAADNIIPIVQTQFWVPFSLFKKPLPKGKYGRKLYATFISTYLKCMSVPEDEHPFVVQKLFDAIEAAVSPVDPVIVSVWDVTHSIVEGHDRPSKFNFIPASRSSIQALEPVTVLGADDSFCAVCWDDSEQKPFTRLPCAHQFHVHCIVQCLEINHLCPYCRYAMPTEEEDYGLLNLFLE